jgi:hypothetical protein
MLPPETMLGLASDRSIAKYTDYFAIGCMLFELFNKGYFFHHYYYTQRAYQAIHAIAGMITHSKSDAKKLQELFIAFGTLKHNVIVPSIDINSNCAPKSIVNILNNILVSLTSFDFRNRNDDINFIHQKIEIMKIIISNHHMDKKRIEARKTRRLLREKKLRKKMDRLNKMLQSTI